MASENRQTHSGVYGVAPPTKNVKEIMQPYNNRIYNKGGGNAPENLLSAYKAVFKLSRLSENFLVNFRTLELECFMS